MLPYLLYAALLLAIFYAFYKLLLEKETFFQLNRWFLIGGLLLCFLIPTIEIPEDWSIRSETPLAQFEPTSSIAERESLPPAFTEEVETPKEEAVALPLTSNSYQDVSPLGSPVASTNPFWKKLDWKQVVWYSYLTGLFLFLFNLLIQLTILIRRILRFPRLKDGKFYIVEMEGDHAPYSFLNYIFINPTKYDWDTYQHILQHEKIHIAQAHSIDMILAELMVVIQWFNPLAWQYRKAIENNLEYLTDSVMLNQGVERQPYQMNLLKVSVPHHPMSLVMNYNQSFLKKRIKMMNAKKSSANTSWKYMAILPIIGLCLICFNTVKVVANQQNKETFIKADKNWDKTLDEWEAFGEAFGEEFGEEFGAKFSEKLEKKLADKFKFRSFGEFSLDLEGIWKADIRGDRVCVQFDNSNQEQGWSWVSSECFDRSAFSALPTSKGAFTLKRAAGTVAFTGEFNGNEGSGSYAFTGNTDFVKTLNQRGIRGEAKEETLFHFFLADINEAYLDELEKMDFDRMDMDQLRKLAIHDVSREYIREMAALGYDDLDPADLVKGKIHDVDPEYIKEIRASGFSNLSFEELVKFSIHDVDAELVEDLAQAGFTNLNAEQIVKASIHNVDPEYLRELAEVGYTFDQLEDVIKFSIHGVDAGFVEELNEAGYTNLDADQIRKAAIHGLDEGYIRDLKETGIELPNIEDLIQFSIHGVRPGYIADLQDLGYKDISADEIRKASIHGIRPSYVEDLNELGFKNIPMEEVIKCKIHGLSARDIRQARADGYKNRSLEEYRKMKIRGTIR